MNILYTNRDISPRDDEPQQKSLCQCSCIKGCSFGCYAQISAINRWMLRRLVALTHNRSKGHCGPAQYMYLESPQKRGKAHLWMPSNTYTIQASRISSSDIISDTNNQIPLNVYTFGGISSLSGNYCVRNKKLRIQKTKM